METPEWRLTRHLGKRGRHFKTLAMGDDARPVRPDRERKSVGAERTFSEDIGEPDEMLDRLRPIAERESGWGSRSSFAEDAQGNRMLNASFPARRLVHL